MEAEKSHDVLSASWRPRKADGIVRSKSKGLRIRRLGFPVQGQEKTNVTAEAGKQEAKDANSFVPHLLFYAGPQQIGWCPPTMRRVTY